MSVRVGVHRRNPTLLFLARTGYLERELARLGDSVEWFHNANGAVTGRLVGDGSIDFGGSGSPAPLIAQALGYPLAYVQVSAPRPDHGALLVIPGGPVEQVADLKGRTVALGVGSWQTHLVAKALSDAGLSYRDVSPSRTHAMVARRMLRDGSAAAWVAQGPELVDAEETGEFEVLIPTREVIADRAVFYTRRELAEDRPDVVAAFATALQRTDDWIADHLVEAAATSAAEQGGSVHSWHSAYARLPWQSEAVTEDFLREQQELADILFEGGFLPSTVRVEQAHLPSLAPVVSEAILQATELVLGAEPGIG